jgi:hypothetical protein
MNRTSQLKAGRKTFAKMVRMAKSEETKMEVKPYFLRHSPFPQTPDELSNFKARFIGKNDSVI